MTSIPLIGVSGYRDTAEHLITNYTESVRRAGGAPVVLPITGDDAVIDKFVSSIDGLVMTGGVDFDPVRCLGEEPVRELGETDPRRDEYDLKLVRAAVRRGIPVLGVCRGHQLMAVAFGGSLWQDFPSQVKDSYIKHRQSPTPGWYGTHTVIIEGGSFLEKALGVRKALVNSLHHQAVRDVPQGFSVVARSADGIIEAIERTGRLAPGYEDGGGMIICTQFHPEIYIKADDTSFLKIFGMLVEEAAKTK